MDVKDIAILVGGCLLALLYFVLLIRAFIIKKKSGKSVDVVQTMAEIAQKVMPLVGAAEVAFKSVSDKKTGALKLKDVLNDIKDMCAEKGIKYNRTYWTDYIKEAVDLININRISTEDSGTGVSVTEKTAETVKQSVDTITTV